MTLPQHWQDFLIAARGGRPERVPVALIVDSPWMPGFAGMHTLDFFLDTDAWLDTYLKVHGAVSRTSCSSPASGSNTAWPTSRAPSGPASSGARTRRPRFGTSSCRPRSGGA